MFEATPKAAPKKKAHENLMDSAEGRVATGEPESADEVIQGIRDRCRQCADTTDAPAEQDSGQTETAEVEEPPAAEADDTPAKEEAVPAASD